MKVYLCAPMSGIPDFNRLEIDNAAAYLRNNGISVVSPVELNTRCGKFPCFETWEQAMRVDISAMLLCDAVVILPEWENSQGAAYEHSIAVRLKIPVLRFTIPIILLHLSNITVKRVE